MNVDPNAELNLSVAEFYLTPEPCSVDLEARGSMLLQAIVNRIADRGLEPVCQLITDEAYGVSECNHAATRLYALLLISADVAGIHTSTQVTTVCDCHFDLMDGSADLEPSTEITVELPDALQLCARRFMGYYGQKPQWMYVARISLADVGLRRMAQALRPDLPLPLEDPNPLREGLVGSGQLFTVPPTAPARSTHLN